MLLTIPEKLSPVKSVNCANYIVRSGADKSNTEFIYDFANMQHCHPYGLLVIACAIRNNIKNRPDAKHEIKNPQTSQGGGFAANFGFYQSMGKP